MEGSLRRQLLRWTYQLQQHHVLPSSSALPIAGLRSIRPHWSTSPLSYRVRGFHTTPRSSTPEIKDHSDVQKDGQTGQAEDASANEDRQAIPVPENASGTKANGTEGRQRRRWRRVQSVSTARLTLDEVLPDLYKTQFHMHGQPLRILDGDTPVYYDKHALEHLLWSTRARMRLAVSSKGGKDAKQKSVAKDVYQPIMLQSDDPGAETFFDVYVTLVAKEMDADILKIDTPLLRTILRKWPRKVGNTTITPTATSKKTALKEEDSASKSNEAEKELPVAGREMAAQVTPSTSTSRLGTLKRAIRDIIAGHLARSQYHRTLFYFGNLSLDEVQPLSFKEQLDLLRTATAAIRGSKAVVIGSQLPPLPSTASMEESHAFFSMKAPPSTPSSTPFFIAPPELEQFEERRPRRDEVEDEEDVTVTNGRGKPIKSMDKSLDFLQRVLSSMHGKQRGAPTSRGTSLPAKAPSRPEIGITVIGVGEFNADRRNTTLPGATWIPLLPPASYKAPNAEWDVEEETRMFQSRLKKARQERIRERNVQLIHAALQRYAPSRAKEVDVPSLLTTDTTDLLSSVVFSPSALDQVCLTALGMPSSSPKKRVFDIKNALRILQEGADMRELYAKTLDADGEKNTVGLNMDELDLNKHEEKFLSCLVRPEAVKVGFKQIACLDRLKDTLQTLITLPLLRPAFFNRGVLKQSTSGVLLFGPPGTGKTMLAKAVAKESGSRFMSINMSNIFDMWIGEGEKNVKAIFTLARKVSPCVIFIDEVDALFSTRSSMGSGESARREVMNEFMTHWDGVTSANKGIVIMAATNRPFDLDDAILRRLPRRLMVDLPTTEERLQILRLLLKDETVASDVNLTKLAEDTPLYSGSDLKNVCIAATLHAVKDVLGLEEKKEATDLLTRLSAAGESKDTGDRLLTSSHFEKALREVPASIQEETGSIVELRKWDKKFGEGAKHVLQKSIGF